MTKYFLSNNGGSLARNISQHYIVIIISVINKYIYLGCNLNARYNRRRRAIPAVQTVN